VISTAACEESEQTAESIDGNKVAENVVSKETVWEEARTYKLTNGAITIHHKIHTYAHTHTHETHGKPAVVS
jgi:hypothetical protein